MHNDTYFSEKTKAFSMLKLSLSWSSILNRLGRLFLATLDIYAVGLILYFILHSLSFDFAGIVFFMSSFVQWLLLPAFIFIFFVLWRRQWKRVILILMPILIFLGLYGQMFLPYRSQAAPANTTTLSVMTLNTANDMPYQDHLLATLRDSDADIIGLQELSPHKADFLAENLQDEYPYRVLHGERIYGKGLLSRYPIINYEFFGHKLANSPFIEAQLDVDGRQLTVIVAHPCRPFMFSDGELLADHPDALPTIQTYLERISLDEPTIMLGDFNMTDQSENYDLIADSGLIDVYKEVGYGFGATFPTRLTTLSVPMPLVRLDYIWVTPQFYPLESHVQPDMGSDHLPLTAKIAW